jgi:hypothetical protein
MIGPRTHGRPSRHHSMSTSGRPRTESTHPYGHPCSTHAAPVACTHCHQHNRSCSCGRAAVHHDQQHPLARATQARQARVICPSAIQADSDGRVELRVKLANACGPEEACRTLYCQWSAAYSSGAWAAGAQSRHVTHAVEMLQSSELAQSILATSLVASYWE